LASFIANILGGNALVGVSKVIDSIRGKSPEDAAKLDALKQQYAADFAQAEIALKQETLKSYDAEVQASAGIITTEAKSQSWLARNVRPLLLLIWGVTISVFAIYNAIAHWQDPKFVPLALDAWVYKLTAIGFTGYVTARTWEKVTNSDK
jgi:hypothetical protein